VAERGNGRHAVPAGNYSVRFRQLRRGILPETAKTYSRTWLALYNEEGRPLRNIRLGEAPLKAIVLRASVADFACVIARRLPFDALTLQSPRHGCSLTLTPHAAAFYVSGIANRGGRVIPGTRNASIQVA
jgi:hypothetical protein